MLWKTDLPGQAEDQLPNDNWRDLYTDEITLLNLGFAGFYISSRGLVYWLSSLKNSLNTQAPKLISCHATHAMLQTIQLATESQML